MFTIQNVTQKQIDAMADELGKGGVEVTHGDGGKFEINGKGIEAEATYAAAPQALTVTIKHKPFFIPESVIEHGIIEAITAIPAQ